MKIASPFIAVVLCIFSCNLGAQTTVPPPPSRSFNNPTIVPPPPSRPAVRVEAPVPFSITFTNGGSVWAKVWLYRDKFVVMDRDRRFETIKRPLPDQARPPSGCKYLHYWLNNNDCHSYAWKQYLQIYLYRCLNER